MPKDSLQPNAVDPVDAWIAKQLATAPPLTDQQRTALAELLRPVRLTAAEWAGDPR